MSSPMSSTMATSVATARAEWARIWTVRSSWAFVVGVTVVVLGMSTIFGYDARHGMAVEPEVGAWEGGQFTGLFGMFVLLALAVVATTADHGTGGIVPTLQWTPRRGVLLAARAVVVVLTTTVLGLLLVATGCVLISLIAPDLGLPAEGASRLLGDLAFVYVCGTVLAVGLGLALRSTAGGLVTVLALMLVLPMLLSQFPYEWAQRTAELMPGLSAISLVAGEGLLTGTAARTTLVCWAVGALLAGGWRLLRTDADR